jgi:hypothetical protein
MARGLSRLAVDHADDARMTVISAGFSPISVISVNQW